MKVIPVNPMGCLGHMISNGRRIGEEQAIYGIKWDHFDILATGQSDTHCKIKETLLIRDLKPALNENVGSEKRLLHLPFIFFSSRLN